MASIDPSVAYVVTDIGGRWEMEDEYVLEVESTKPLRVVGAVFDGHGGSAVAKLAAARFPKLFRDALPNGPEDAFRIAYASIHREARGLRGGAVASTFYIDGSEMFVANAGDAHVATVSGPMARRLTEDHRITNESELRRIVGAGAAIWGPYVSLPSGSGLMATRTLGDHEFESIGVLAEPVTSRHRLEPGFLVAACDGLWDFVRTEELPTLLKGLSTAEEAAGALAHEALHVRRTSDNLTILVVRIP
ncbi:MAG TPA: PP2C family protein-serine/threonine phosphatase [Thermoplasmata archaeon]